MQRIVTASLGDVFEPEDANELQDKALGIAQVPGLSVGPAYVRCAGGVSIDIGSIPGMMLGNPNSKLSTALEQSYFPSGIVGSTQYYLYVRNDSGSLAFTHDTVGPDINTGYRFKNGDTSQIYLAPFATDSAGTSILAFRKVGNLYLWGYSHHPAGTFDALTNGSSTSFANVVLSPLVPPHVRSVKIKGLYRVKFNQFCTGRIRTKGFTGGDHEFPLLGASSDSGSPARSLERNIQTIDMIASSIGSDRLIEYKVDNADDQMTVQVLGFYE